jgi:hypothetical protein
VGKNGWEVVSQTPGRLRTEIKVRRSKPKSRTFLYAVGGGALAVVVTIIIIIIGTVNERNTARTQPTTSPVVATEPPPSPAATDAPSSSPTAEAAQATVITAEDSPEFATLLGSADYYNASIPAFAEKYQGQQIGFVGNVGTLTNHGDAATRYDILIGAENYGETSQSGPAFQFRDVNLTSDLHYAGDVPDSLAVAKNVQIVAEVGPYEPSSCLLMLDPVETSFR